MADRYDGAMLTRAASEVPGCDRPDFTLRREDGLGIAKLRLLGADPDAGFRALTGRVAPAARTQVEADGLTYVWLAPGEWLVTGAEAMVAAAVARLAAAGGDAVLALDLTHGRTAFRLSGPAARDRLAAVSPLDVWDGVFPAGAVARTLLGETVMVLARLPDRDEGPDFRIIVDQTMAAYASRMLAGPAPSGAVS